MNEAELREDNKFLQATIRELRGRLDETTMRLSRSKDELYKHIIKPRLELEELISRYNDGQFDDFRTDKSQSLERMKNYLPENHPILQKYKDEV